MNILKISSLLLLMSPCAVSSAASAGKDNDFPCKNYTTAYDIGKCYQDIVDVRKKEMNTVFEKLHKNYKDDDPNQALSLDESQRAWVKFKDANCRMETWDSRMGTGFGEYWNRCEIDMIESREKELRRWLDMP